MTRRALNRISSLALGGLLAPMIRIDVAGIENLPESGAYLLASNHASHLDTSAIRRALGSRRASRLQVMAARDYFFTSRWRSWLFRVLFNVLPFDRAHRSLQGLELCQRILDGGCPVLIYPEGTRSKTGEMRPFRPGIGILAAELGYEVVPVRITGTFDSLPPGRRWPRPGRIGVRFGRPQSFAHDAGSAGVAKRGVLYRETARRVEQAVAALGPEARPR